MSFIELTAVLGNVGEFVDSVAVLLTLIYLAVQLKQNTETINQSHKVALADIYQARANSVNDAIRSINPEILVKLTEGNPGWYNINPENIDTLSALEREQLTSNLWCLITHIDSVQFQRELGLITEYLDQDDETYKILYPICRKLNIPLRPSFAKRVKKLGLDDEPEHA